MESPFASLHLVNFAQRGERQRVEVNGEAVVVTLDPGGVQGAQEHPVGADERTPEHSHARIGLLDRGIGGAQQFGVALRLVRPREIRSLAWSGSFQTSIPARAAP